MLSRTVDCRVADMCGLCVHWQDGDTPLMVAIRSKHHALVELFLAPELGFKHDITVQWRVELLSLSCLEQQLLTGASLRLNRRVGTRCTSQLMLVVMQPW